MKRLGFLGLGWIGRHRMDAMLATGLVEAIAFADPAPDPPPNLHQAASLEALLDLNLDGLVIATPSALHAAQAITALNRGVAVFCQKPLGRNAKETAAVIDAAKTADKLLGVDLSYRGLEATQRIRDLIQSGTLGQIFAVDLVFHNAYGPGKPWFYDQTQSGGGCVIDLGVHLVDLALWTLGFPQVENVTAHLFAKGQPLQPNQVEDYATATLTLAPNTTVHLTCSWNLHAGQDAIISATFHGTKGGASLQNQSGSFYDFTANHHQATTTHPLTTPPDPWNGRTAATWATQLATGQTFNESATQFLKVAEVLDRIYAP